jgi:hypothetical protein
VLIRDFPHGMLTPHADVIDADFLAFVQSYAPGRALPGATVRARMPSVAFSAD